MQPSMSEPIAFAPKEQPLGYSWWIGIGRDGFTNLAALTLNVRIPVDDVTDREAQVIVRRRDVLTAIVVMQQVKSNAVIRHAIELSRN